MTNLCNNRNNCNCVSCNNLCGQYSYTFLPKIPVVRSLDKKEIKTGNKNDSGKLIMSELLSSNAYSAVSAVLTHGAKKYERGNWKLGFEESRLIDAAIGHINSHLTGELLDKESHLPHLAHAMCSLVFALEDDKFERYNRNTLLKDENNKL